MIRFIGYRYSFLYFCETVQKEKREFACCDNPVFSKFSQYGSGNIKNLIIGLKRKVLHEMKLLNDLVTEAVYTHNR